jgi:hypothetical protein
VSTISTHVELQIGGAWTEITPDVYLRDGISITRGKSSEGASDDPGRCTLTINNAGGKYSPRNPVSPYYGQIGRNTPIRVSVDAGSTYLATAGTTNSTTGASTPDAGALDITGDIDIRFEATLDNWLASGSVELCGKGLITGNQRSWLFMMRDQKPHFEWSTAGTSTISVDATADLSQLLPPSRRLAVRVTLDVDNGAGGNTVTFYTAPSIAGPWTQLGTPVVTAGTTSIFNSTAPVRAGDGWGDLAFPNCLGKVNRFELRNGINGTVVANPDFTAQTPGAASFVDSTGKAWTVGIATSISNRRTRFVGEVSAWPTEWHPSGNDIWVKIQASGILRRLSQGASPLQSVMRREMTNPARQNVRAYWPCEDGRDATTLASAIPGAPPLRVIASGVQPARDTTWAASDALPTMGTGTVSGYPPAYTATGQTSLRMYLQLPNSGVTTAQRLISLTCSGTATTWSVSVNPSAAVAVRAYDRSGTMLLDSGFVPFLTIANGRPANLVLELIETGGNVSVNLTLIDLTTATLTTVAFSTWPGTLTGQTVGRVTKVLVGEDAALTDTVIGHIAIADSTAAYAGTNAAIVAWASETARSRMVRLAGEEQIPLTAYGVGADLMGPQRIDTVLGLLSAAGAVGGSLTERREALALCFRGRDVDYNQMPKLTLDYTAPGLAPPLTPVDDDQRVRNDITVSRDGGASARVTLDTGTLSTQSPPNGVGRYDDSTTLNVFSDDQLPQFAGWGLALGTWDEARYPSVRVNLAKAPSLVDSACALELRDVISITHLPPWLPPGDALLLVEGYTETLKLTTWDVVFVCSPAGPWNVATLDDVVYGRADTDGSVLAASATSAATSLLVSTTSGPIWTTDPAEMPIDLRVGGEVVRATAVASSAVDSFARTVSNGWGTTDTGQTWTNTGGTAADFNVTSNSGRHSQGSLNTRRWSTFPTTTADFDARVNFATSAFPAGDNEFAFMVGRFIDTNNTYMVRAQLAPTTGAISLSIRKRVAGTETDLGTVATGVVFAAGTIFWIRFRAQGTSLAAKVWLGTSPEPDWQNQVTDSDLTAAGSVGVVSQLGASSTNTLPVTFFWDAFEVLNPQAFTVTRSINGIAKPQSAGSDVRLAYPAIAAL